MILCLSKPHELSIKKLGKNLQSETKRVFEVKSNVYDFIVHKS